MWKVIHQCPFTMSNKKVLLQIFKYFLSCPAIICVDFNLLIFIYVFVCWLASHLYASGFYNFNIVVFMVFRSLMCKSYYIFACKILFFVSSSLPWNKLTCSIFCSSFLFGCSHCLSCMIKFLHFPGPWLWKLSKKN